MIGLWLACQPPPEASVALVEGGIEVRANRPLREVSVRTADGRPVLRRALPRPGPRVVLPVTPPLGASWLVETELAGQRRILELAGPTLPVTVEIEAPAGQGRRPVSDGDRLEVWTAPGSAEARLVLTAREPAWVRVDGVERHLATPGERWSVPVPLDRPRAAVVEQAEGSIRVELVPRALDPATARERLRLVDVRLPADPDGATDPTRPAGRLVLPLLGRRAPPELPVTWQSATVRNTSDAPIDVVVTSTVEDADGRPIPAFRSRVRSQEGQPAVAVLLRVPAEGEAVAALPVFADDPPAGEVWSRVTVVPLGAAAPTDEARLGWVVERGAPVAWGAFAAAVAVSAAGWALVALRGRRFLAAAPTADLTTIGLFASATFVVGAVFQLLGYGVAALLGPFAPLLTGWVDEGFRAALLGTLLTLLPRPGVFAAATVVGFLLRAIAFGGLHPVDLLYVGSSVAVHEGWLWAVGLTRGRPANGWRLAAGLAPANAVCVLLGLATSAVLYRLYYAEWYVAALALGPGLLYVAVGCAVAAPIARSLRRVAA